MAVLTKQSINRAGVGPTYAAAAGGGDQVAPSAQTFLHVKNGSGGALTVTVAAVAGAAPYANLPIGNLAVSVPAGGERMIGPILPAPFADPANSGNAVITYSGVTSLTIAALELTQP
jgi:hypothetical protein